MKGSNKTKKQIHTLNLIHDHFSEIVSEMEDRYLAASEDWRRSDEGVRWKIEMEQLERYCENMSDLSFDLYELFEIQT